MAALSGYGQSSRGDSDTSFSFYGITLPAWFCYSLLLFIVSRAILTAIGIIGYGIIAHKDMARFPDFLRIWDVWDSDRYIYIAQHWYPQTTNVSQMTNYVFFPLYPLLMKLLAAVTNDPFVAGLIVSNVSLFIACSYIYKLARLTADEDTAMRSVKYLFLFPTAFILSGVFTESLFLALSIACFYHAKKRNWIASGILGALAAVTRPYGIIILVPMLCEYLCSIDLDPRRLGPGLLGLLITPLGLCAFMAYEFYMTGDFLAFAHAQSLWGYTLQNPLLQLYIRLTEMGMDVRFNAIMTLAAILMLLAGYKMVGFSQLIYGLLLILIPLTSPASLWSMARYILIIFPLFIICARYAKNQYADQAMTIGLAMAQGLLMATWATWGFYVI